MSMKDLEKQYEVEVQAARIALRDFIASVVKKKTDLPVYGVVLSEALEEIKEYCMEEAAKMLAKMSDENKAKLLKAMH